MTRFVEYKVHQETFTAQQLDEAIAKEKPYLIELEKAVAELGYGTIDLKLEVRAGAVEKMNFFFTRNWLRPKEGHLQS